MKRNNDLIHSSILSMLVVILVAGYYYFKFKNNIPENPTINQHESLQDSVSVKDFDVNLIDTTTSYFLDESEVWSELYPGKKSKQNQYGGISKRAIMRVKKGENKKLIYYYSTIHRIFYYKHEGKQKAFVVLVSYPFDYYTEQTEECHACSPEFSIANWVYKEGGWSLENFTESWEGGMGSWGQPTALTFKITSLGYSLEMDHGFCQAGYCEGYYVMYEIPSLKIVTDKSYTTNVNDDLNDNEVELVDSTANDGN